MWNTDWKLWCLPSAIWESMYACMVNKKGLYFLDHWFIFIKPPNTVPCESASGVCFSCFIYFELKSPPAFWMLKQPGLDLLWSQSLPCQWLFISFMFRMDDFSESLTIIFAQYWLWREHPLGLACGIVPNLAGRAGAPTSVPSPLTRHMWTSSLKYTVASCVW